MQACSLIWQRSASCGPMQLNRGHGEVTTGPCWGAQGPAAATGIAVINSVGNVGGMVGPMLIGWLRHKQASYATGVTVLASVTMAAAVLVFLFPMHPAAPVPRGGALPRAPSSGDQLGKGAMPRKEAAED